jgi:tRNA A37 methylthiotransferase MiaB
MALSKKVFLITNGCPESCLDLARMQEFLKHNEWEITRTIEEADVVLFNSCGLTGYNQEVSIKLIKQLKARKSPSAELIVYGCRPQINEGRLREVYQGFTFGSDEIKRLGEKFEFSKSPQDIHANFLLPFTEDIGRTKWRIPNLKKLRSLMDIKEALLMGHVLRLWRAINAAYPYSFCIKVCTGCLSACAFCAVKLSRGNVKSKSISQVLAEFEDGLAKGYREFALIGTDLGSYGREQGTTLVELLKELTSREGEYQIRLRNMQPRFLIEMMPELQDIFQSGKIAYLSSAAESGSNRILKLMQRGYQIEDFKDVIRTINTNFPYIQIRSQLMVGFPSETEEEFQDSVRLLDEVRFDLAEVYPFEPRPGTKAAGMSDPVPPNITRRRFHHLFMKSFFNQRARKKRALRDYKQKLSLYQHLIPDKG